MSSLEGNKGKQPRRDKGVKPWLRSELKYEGVTHKEAQVIEALREAEEKLRFIFESIGDGITILDMQGNVVDINEQAVRIGGHTSKEQVIGRNGLEFIRKEDRDSAANSVMKALAEGRASGTIEYRLVTADGDEKDVQVSVAPLKDKTGKPVGIITVTRDISARKRAEEVARGTADKLNTILQSVGDAITVVDLRGTIVEANEAAARLSGYSSKEELVGKRGLELVSPKDRDLAAEVVSQAMKGGHNTNVIEYSLRTADDSEKEVEVSFAPFCDSSGETVGIITAARDVSERRRMEQAVRASEEKLRVMFDSAIDGIVVVDMLGNIQELNEGITRITGYTRDDFIGRSALDFVYPEDQKIVVDMMASTLGDKRLVVNALTLRMVHKNGTMFVGELACGVMHDKQGNITGFIGTLRDVTERKQMEDQLRASEEKLRAMFESIHDAVIVSDMQGTIVDVNDAALRISGWTREQWIGRNAIEIIAEKDRAAAIDSLMKQSQSGIVAMGSAELTLVLGEGRELDAEFTTSFLRDTTGNPIGTVTVARDITERKKAAEAVRASEEKMRAIFDSAIDGILLIDLMGNFQDANEATLKMTGYSREDLIGKSALEFVFEEDRQKVVNELTNTLTSKQLVSAKPLLRLVRKDRSLFYAELGSGMIQDKQGNVTGLIGVMRDVTERKRLEDEVRASEEKLRGIFEAISDSVILTTPDGCVIDLNDAAVRLHGYSSKEELIGKNALELVVEKDRQKVAEQGIKAAKRVGTFDSVEYRVRRADGSEFDAEFNGIPLCDDTGKVVRWVTMSRDITERKRMQEELRVAAEKMRITFEAITDAIVVTNELGGIVQTNEATARLSGYSREELIGKSGLDLIAPEYREVAVQTMGKVFEEGHGMESMELQFLTADGRRVDAEFGTAMLRDASGNPIGFVSVARDITERKQMEKAIMENEAKFRELFENMSNGVAVYEAVDNGEDFVFKDFNRAAEKIGNTTKDKVIGKSIAEAYPKLKEFGLFAVMQRVWRTGNAERMPAAYYEDELRKGWRDNYVYKLPTGEVVAVYEDVTDHITAMESVRSSEEKLRAMFESTSDGIVVTDMRFNILDANEAAARIFGHKSKASLIGTSALGMISADKVVDADGKQINIEFSLSQMRDAAGNLTGNIGVVRDVTVRRRMEANLKKTVTNLERSNRDMQQFVYIASHDLQEPLRMISSFTQLLNRRYKGKLDAEADDFITYAVNGANVLQERIQALTTFSRVSTQGKPFVHTDMGLVLDKALASLNAEVESSKAVVTHDPMPSIVADGAQMAQVFQYLIDNAIKFRSEATPQIHVSAKEQDSERVFSVSDNGMGIMSEFKERIFVLFQRLHGVEFGGTGIGLPVCKKIVERHGGRIWVESVPGKGSTFYFAIPKEIPEEEPAAGPAAGA